MALTHPNFPLEALPAATTHPNPKVRHSALWRPDCPPEAITAAVAAHRDEPTAQIAVSHPQCPPSVMRTIAETALAAGDDHDPAFEHHDQIHPQTFQLRTNRYGIVLPAAVAALELLDGPAELFAAAARSNNHHLRTAAITNPACPPDVITTAAHQPHTAADALSNPSRPPETLTAALDTFTAPPGYDTYRPARRRIAANPNCPPERLIELCDDESPSVVRAALANPSTPRPARAKTIDTLLR